MAEFMKQALFYGQRRIEVQSVPIPAPKDDEVLLKVHACAICGSEKGLYRSEQALAEPRTAGHEYAGEIVDLGKGVTRLKVGQRAAMFTGIYCGECYYCRRGWWKYCPQVHYHDGMKGFGQYVVVPECAVLPFPDSISYDRGALLTDSMGTPGRAIRRLGVAPGDWVAIFGLGGIGMNAARFARMCGATVVGIDLYPFRRTMAVDKFGVDHVLDAADPDLLDSVRALSRDGLGPDKVVEASGSPVGYQSALKVVRPGGRVGFVGEVGKMELDVSGDIIHRHLEIVGSWFCQEEDFVLNVGLVGAGKFDPLAIVTHTYPLSQVGEAFRVFVDAPDECLKVIVEPWA